MLQLLTIINYSRRIIGFLSVIVYLLGIFDTGRDPTRPIQDGKFCDPTQSNPWMDTTHVPLCPEVTPSGSVTASSTG